MEILALKLVLAASVIVLADAQFKMAKHGASCVDFSPFEPMKVCDHDVGLDCLGSKKGGKSKKAGAVCSCYGSFVYDWVSLGQPFKFSFHSEMIPACIVLLLGKR